MATPGVTYSATNTTRILIVEDEGIIACDIRKIVEDLGYQVTAIAASSPEALASLSLRPADLVLMDIRIRGPIDGIETAESIRHRFQIPVVYLTAHADTNTLDRAKASEPFGYVVKPFTTGDIKVAVEIALQRHRRQRDIEERDAWTTAVLRSIGEAIVVTDADARVTYLNHSAEELLGVSFVDVRGRPVDEIVQLLDEPESLNISSELENQEGVQISTGLLRRPDGSDAVVIQSLSPIQDESDARGCTILLRDVSDLRKTEQALRESNLYLTRSNEQLSALSHSIAHDLKEPLRTVKCYSGLLAGQAEELLTASQQQYLSYITDGCTRLDEMLTSLLDYYRAGVIDAATAELADASQAFERALSNLNTSIALAGASIDSAPLPWVRAHPTALLQIFQNLISNAIRYRSPDRAPIIRVELAEDEHFWRFTVADNSSGFQPEQAEHIFGLFKRVHGREETGAGIGLATCRRLIEQYGGRIWAESAVGVGSRFHFTLPKPSDV